MTCWKHAPIIRMLFTSRRPGIMPEEELYLNLTTKPGLGSQLVADPEMLFDRRDAFERVAEVNFVDSPMSTACEHYPLDSLVGGVIDGLLDMGIGLAARKGAFVGGGSSQL